PTSIIYLALSDLVLVFLAFRLIFSGDSTQTPHLSDVFASQSLKLSVMVGIGAAISGLYDTKSFLTYRSMAAQILLSLLFTVTILAFAGMFFVDRSAPFDWLWEIQKAALTWLICILLTRAVFITIADLDAFKRKVLVLGSGELAERIR